MKRFLVLALVVACGPSGSSGIDQTTTPNGPPPAMERLRFNQLAVRLNLPIFWEADRNDNGQPDADEMRTLAFYPQAPAWVGADGAPTPAFTAARDAILAASTEPPTSDERQRLVRLELETTAPTLLHTDLSTLPPAHRAFAQKMLVVGGLMDRLYARQVGMTALEDQVADDAASRSLFRRNWGSDCLGPHTENEAACSAIEGHPAQPVDVYPAALQTDGFCGRLTSQPNAAELSTPFTVVRAGEGEGALRAVPYTEAYPEMAEVASALREAVAAIQADPEEAALVAYLEAAAQAFTTNQWEPADEAWAAMNARNSKWYVRVAPDEVYWDPCALKAGFHMTFARIDTGSLVWQDRLTPIQGDMENSLAALAPDVYEAREVAFHMPDFIAIVSNHGDDRDPFGATIGQSLPNWGPVAIQGRGRTVAMTNLYTDTDSLARGQQTAASLLSPETMALYTSSPEAGLMSTILHEATHNLGPANEYKVNDRNDTEIFGGGMASMLEELKAQSGALFFVELLRERGILTEQAAHETYLDSMVWTFGHVSRGMYTASGNRKAYSQLAAIQLGWLMENGVVEWDPEAQAANGEDRGAFTIHFDQFAAKAAELMAIVVRIKAAGDKPAADALAARYVDGDVVPMQTITERHLRQPRGSFVFSIDP